MRISLFLENGPRAQNNSVSALFGNRCLLTMSVDRGATWSTEEIRCLIKIWGKDNVQLEFEGTKRNKHIYDRISEEMKRRGFDRSYKQCQTKVKSLRKEYRDTKDHNNKSGKQTKRFRYFEEIDQILGSRPAKRPNVMLTSVKTEEDSASDTEYSEVLVKEEDKDQDEDQPEQQPAADENNTNDQSDEEFSRPTTPGAPDDTDEPTTPDDRPQNRYVTRVDKSPLVKRRPKVKLSRASGTSLEQSMASFIQAQEDADRRSEELEERRFNRKMEMEDKRLKWDMEMAERRMKWQEEMEERRQKQMQDFELMRMKEKEEAEMRREKYREEMELRREKQRQEFELRCHELKSRSLAPQARTVFVLLCSNVSNDRN